VTEGPRHNSSRGPSPERTAVALEKPPQGWDCERAPGHRPRGAQLLPIGRSNGGDRRDRPPREASRPRRGRRRAGTRSPVEALRPIDAFSFQSPSSSFRMSRQDPLVDRESGPRSERRIRHLGAMSRPVREGRTQNEMPQSVRRGLQRKTLIPGPANQLRQDRRSRSRAPFELPVPTVHRPIKERAATMAITQNPANWASTGGGSRLRVRPRIRAARRNSRARPC